MDAPRRTDQRERGMEVLEVRKEMPVKGKLAVTSENIEQSVLCTKRLQLPVTENVVDPVRSELWLKNGQMPLTGFIHSPAQLCIHPHPAPHHPGVGCNPRHFDGNKVVQDTRRHCRDDLQRVDASHCDCLSCRELDLLGREWCSC